MESPLLVVGLVLGGLCLLGILLSFIMPLLSGLFTVLSAVLEVGLDVMLGGPVAWCGCLVLLILLVVCCGLVAVAAYSLSTCNTPNPVQFCTWFGL